MLSGCSSGPCRSGAARHARLAAVTKKRVVSGMRPTGKLHLGHLAGALDNWVALQRDYDCFYFVADWHALTSHFADTSELIGQRGRQRGRLDRRRHRPRAQHDLRAVDDPRARRAVPAAADGHADPLAGARAHLQGADRAAHRARPGQHRLPRLSAAADRRRHHLRRQLRAGGRRPGAAPRAVARGGAPLQQHLRRGAGRAADDAHADAAAARARQPQDEQELRATPSTSPTTRRRS